MTLTLSKGYWTGASGGGSDPYWDSVQFLANFDQSPIIDVSDNGFALSGDTTSRDTSNQLHGSGCFDAGDKDYYLASLGNDILNFPSSSALWTFEVFCKPSSFAAPPGGTDNVIASAYRGTSWSSDANFYLNFDTSGVMSWQQINSGITYIDAGTLTVNVWNYVAVVADGTNVNTYHGLVSAGSATRETQTANPGMNGDDGDYFRIAAYRLSPAAVAPSFRGLIDSVRVTSGVARYSGSSFTIPGEFPTA